MVLRRYWEWCCPKVLRIYWEAYGGWSALWKSAYLWGAIVAALLCSWFKVESFLWDNAAISILPDILGFSLGGYVIMVGFGDTEFIEALRGRESKESGPSIYMKINATFVHFIVVQAITLFLALMSSAVGIASNPYVSFVGTFFLFYAIATILAATFGVLTFANWYDQKPKD